MAYEFKFPDIGEGLTEGEIVRWLVKEGDEIKEGQPLVEVETDKALAEIPSPKNRGGSKDTGQRERDRQGRSGDRYLRREGRSPAAPPPPPPKTQSVGVVGELEEAPEEAPAVE